MALSLFTRRPAVQDPTTWTPPGTIVVQRYRNIVGPAEGAIVLVYTVDSDRRSGYFATACLGCTYRAASSDRLSRLTEKAAADLANAHAASCRAMNCGVPAGPDDTEAAQMVRSPAVGPAPALHHQPALRPPHRLPRGPRRPPA
ncbi:hypothetical protein GCM10009577_79370 [Streptomyces javensis]|uniref:hypothetical protein n=1 Tax=Streptomyces javensis TaxID=114698 RepID=UPI0031D5EA92